MKKYISSLIYGSSPAEKSKNNSYWVGASLGVLFLAFSLAMLSASNSTFGIDKIWIILIAILASILSIIVFAVLSQLVIRSIKLYPAFFVTAIGASIGLLMVLKNTRFGIPNEYFYWGGLLTLVSVSAVFGSLFLFFAGAWRSRTSGQLTIVIVSFLIGAGFLTYVAKWLVQEGENPYKISFVQKELNSALLTDLKDPSQRGTYEVRKFTYGSGTNKKRPEFGEKVDYKSEVVNGKYILPQWKKEQAEKRSDYWGFDVGEWPLNGIVYMPVGKGPFPVVLIAHGNHNMEEYSDPGYGYLGELLASRGYITVSVDENYINGSWAGDFRGKELPARAWLLLKHLEQWRAWNEDSTHELSGKADLSQIALIGHSRGGEAVPIAAAFNTLTHFPDDAREKFNFNFGIKSVIAIAPTDYRYDRRVRIENVDFLGLQGSYDSDEDSFYGLRQLQRTDFTDANFHLKAGVYIHGANHGQFNSIWGQHDSGFPGNLFLNTKPMISGEDQRKYAEVLISAFLETSIRGNEEYAAVFRDLRTAKKWLPESTLALSLYEDTKIDYWADFEEDIELTTTSNGRVTSEGFDIWGEDYLQFRAGLHQENHALTLGWIKDSIPEQASYTIQFDSVLSLSKNDFLTFSIGSGDPALLGDVKDDSLKNHLVIVLTDSLGKKSSVALSDYKLVAPRLKIRFLKTKKLTTSRYKNEWEPVLETMFVPLNAFAKEELDLGKISSVSIEANTGNSGIVLIDRIGVLQSN